MKWLDKYQNGDIDFDGVAKAVRNVESLDGKLMWNPQSSATGLFGQRFSEIKNDYKGSRKEFAKDTTAQKHYFKKRFHEGLEDSDTTSLKRDAYELYEEYSPQIENFDYSKEDISVLSNFLGRQGTRKFLGNHVRDGKPLSEALPKIYGEGKKQSNKTPQEYLDKAREYYDPKPKQNGGWLDKLEDGGVVKDNEGYWNPDNHGKVVEINSNNITMKGVNQELLGVSDTGDTKVMKPGKNYKFKGTKVREYPVTQNGGWLDKY